MPILNSIPVVGTTLVDFNQQPGISFEMQGGPLDNQGTPPVPFTSQLTFQYGDNSTDGTASRDGAAYQGGYGSAGVLGGGNSAGGGGSKMSDPMIP